MMLSKIEEKDCHEIPEIHCRIDFGRAWFVCRRANGVRAKRDGQPAMGGHVVHLGSWTAANPAAASAGSSAVPAQSMSAGAAGSAHVQSFQQSDIAADCS